MSTAYGPHRNSTSKQKGSDKKTKDTEVPDSSESVPQEHVTRVFAITVDTNTAEVVKLETLDDHGTRHELSDEERAALAKLGTAKKLEEIVEQAFEAGIACVLGDPEEREQPQETAEDAELRHLLLTPLILRSSAKRLMHSEVLNRAILGTLIEHSRKAAAETHGGTAAGLQ